MYYRPIADGELDDRMIQRIDNSPRSHRYSISRQVSSPTPHRRHVRIQHQSIVTERLGTFLLWRQVFFASVPINVQFVVLAAFW